MIDILFLLTLLLRLHWNFLGTGGLRFRGPPPRRAQRGDLILRACIQHAQQLVERLEREAALECASHGISHRAARAHGQQAIPAEHRKVARVDVMGSLSGRGQDSRCWCSDCNMPCSSHARLSCTMCAYVTSTSRSGACARANAMITWLQPGCACVHEAGGSDALGHCLAIGSHGSSASVSTRFCPIVWLAHVQQVDGRLFAGFFCSSLPAGYRRVEIYFFGANLKISAAAIAIATACIFPFGAARSKMERPAPPLFLSSKLVSAQSCTIVCGLMQNILQVRYRLPDTGVLRSKSAKYVVVETFQQKTTHSCQLLQC